MLTLTTVPQPAPNAAPGLNMADMVKTTARVIPQRGEEFYLCNPMDEIIKALHSGEPFVAHTVVGMKAKRMIIAPGTIARIEEV